MMVHHAAQYVNLVMSAAVVAVCMFMNTAWAESSDQLDTILVTAETNMSTTTANNTIGDGKKGDKSTADTGAVVAASIIAVLACIFIVIIVYFIKRKRQTRMMDKEKQMQIQMSSARNAGVYQDLTVSIPDERAPASPEHEKLTPAENA